MVPTIRGSPGKSGGPWLQFLSSLQLDRDRMSGVIHESLKPSKSFRDDLIPVRLVKEPTRSTHSFSYDLRIIRSTGIGDPQDLPKSFPVSWSDLVRQERPS